MDETEVNRSFEIQLPPGAVSGLYADFASVWHTADVFVMDFVAIVHPPASANNPDTGKIEMKIPGQVVQRVRIPPAQVFEMAKALTIQLEAWEQETGRRPVQGPPIDQQGSGPE